MNEHIGDNAALYALGLLDAPDRSAVEAHVAQCEPCTALLGAAEADVATIAQTHVLHDAPRSLDSRMASSFARKRVPWYSYAGAIAAALLIGILPSAYFYRQNAAMHEAMVADAQAMSRLAATPHQTAAFKGMTQGSAASVMYAPDGSWYVILVRGASRAFQVAWMHEGKRTMLGTAQPLGDVAVLYLPKS